MSHTHSHHFVVLTAGMPVVFSKYGVPVHVQVPVANPTESTATVIDYKLLVAVRMFTGTPRTCI